MTHRLFVESNTTGTGRIAVERSAKEGQVTFITRSPAKYPFLQQLANVDVVVAETNELAALERAVMGVHGARPVTAILSFSTYYIELVGRVARKLGMRSVDPDAARRCHHKELAREALRKAGAPTPPFWLVRSLEELERVRDQVTFPCVVKPPSDSGSLGVHRVDDFPQLKGQVQVLSSRAVNDRGQALDGGVLIEGYVRGPEFSVETFTRGAGDHHVFGVTKKHLSPEPYFVEVGHDFPAAIPAAEAAALVAATRQGLDAMGFDFGFAHTELRLTKDGGVIIEINPRLAGGMIPELVGYATGIDLLKVLFDALEGRPFSLSPSLQDTASIRFILAPRSGRLAGVTGQAEARAVAGIKSVDVTKPAGAQVEPARSSSDRLGHVIAAGRDWKSVAVALEDAQRQLRVEIAS